MRETHSNFGGTPSSGKASACLEQRKTLIRSRGKEAAPVYLRGMKTFAQNQGKGNHNLSYSPPYIAIIAYIINH